MEHLIDEQEEIIEPVFGQSGSNRSTAIALAKLLVLNVRVRNIIATGCGVRIKCHDPIGMGSLANVGPAELYLELA